MTIHKGVRYKSQGTTVDRAVLNRGLYKELSLSLGLTYVAISRVRTLDRAAV